ncbi:MAG TPA: hypothetical protein VJZ94_01505 [Candidatus Paceibacterota bacterium]|nr:hypothetical protein [Candidatus Paceibacterota bacterium]
MLFAAGHGRPTTVSTTLPLFIGAVEAKLKATVVVAQQFLPRVGMCPPPQKNESLYSGSGHIVSSGKNNGVLTFTLCAMPSGGKRSGSEAIVYCRAVGCSSLPRTAGVQVKNGPCERKDFFGKRIV